METLLFGMTPRELMEAGLLSVAALYIIRSAFASMQRSDEMNEKQSTKLLGLLSDILTKFPTTIASLGSVVKSLEATVTSLSGAINSFISGMEKKYEKLEEEVANLRGTVEGLELLIKHRLPERTVPPEDQKIDL